MNNSRLQSLLWFTSGGLEVLLVCALYVRRLYFEVPTFCTWVLTNIIASVLLYIVGRYGGSALYAISYYAAVTVDTTLQVAVVLDFARRSLRERDRWLPGTRRALIVAALLAIAIGTGLSSRAQPSAGSASDVIFVRISLFGTMLVLLLSVTTLFLSYENGCLWRKPLLYLFGGFLVWSAFSGLSDTLHILPGTSSGFDLVETARNGSTVLVTAFWFLTVMLWKDKRSDLQADVHLEKFTYIPQ